MQKIYKEKDWRVSISTGHWTMIGGQHLCLWPENGHEDKVIAYTSKVSCYVDSFNLRYNSLCLTSFCKRKQGMGNGHWTMKKGQNIGMIWKWGQIHALHKSQLRVSTWGTKAGVWLVRFPNHFFWYQDSWGIWLVSQQLSQARSLTLSWVALSRWSLFLLQ